MIRTIPGRALQEMMNQLDHTGGQRGCNGGSEQTFVIYSRMGGTLRSPQYVTKSTTIIVTGRSQRSSRLPPGARSGGGTGEYDDARGGGFERLSKSLGHFFVRQIRQVRVIAAVFG